MESVTYGNGATSILAAVVNSAVVRAWLVDLRRPDEKQEDFALRVGLSQGTISKIENQEAYDFSLNTVVKIVRAIGGADKLSAFFRQLEEPAKRSETSPLTTSKSEAQSEDASRSDLVHESRRAISALATTLDPPVASAVADALIGAGLQLKQAAATAAGTAMRARRSDSSVSQSGGKKFGGRKRRS